MKLQKFTYLIITLLIVPTLWYCNSPKSAEKAQLQQSLMSHESSNLSSAAYISPANSSSPLYLNVENNKLVLNDQPTQVVFSDLDEYGSFYISINGLWLIADSTNKNLTLSSEKPPGGTYSYGKWKGYVPDSDNTEIVKIGNAGIFSGGYLSVTQSKKLTLTDSDSTNTHFKFSMTPAYVSNTYFLKAVGSNSNFIALKDNKTVRNSDEPTAVTFASNNGGKSSLILFDEYLLYLDTAGGNVELQLLTQNPISTINYLDFLSDFALWQIEQATSPHGTTYGIFCELNGQRYYLNNAYYDSLSIMNPTTQPLAWANVGHGSWESEFWHFVKGGFAYTRSSIVTNYVYDNYCSAAYDGASFPPFVYTVDGSKVIMKAKNNLSGNWNWKLRPKGEGEAEVFVSNLDNTGGYLVPSILPSSNYNSEKQAVELSLSDSPLARTTSTKIVSSWKTSWLPEVETGETFSARFDTEIKSPQISYMSGISWDTVSNQFFYTECKWEGQGGATYNYSNVVDTTYDIYYTNRSNITANQKNTTSYPELKGPIVQPLSYTEEGTDKFYIYGDTSALFVVKRNEANSASNETITYSGDTAAIYGASVHKSYLYLLNESSLVLYSLFGIDDQPKGQVSLAPLEASSAVFGSPVYNPMSHQIYGVNAAGIVYGYDQSFSSYPSPYTKGLAPMPAEPYELFVIPNSNPETYLYYKGVNDSLVRFEVTKQNKIEPNGKAVSVTEKELSWLRYKTQMLNYVPAISGMEIAPIENGYVATGPIGTDSTFALFFVQDPILQSAQVSLYIGESGALPDFSDLSTIPAVNYNKKASMGNWTVVDANGNNLFFQGMPLVSYTKGIFSIESLVKNSSDSDTTSVYTYSLKVKDANAVPETFNLEWQKTTGQSVDSLTKGSPLHLWYQFNWMKNSTLFPQK